MARLSTKQLSQWCYRLGSSINAGVDVRKAIANEAAHGAARHRQVMVEVDRQVAAGRTFSEALRTADGHFPSLVCDMVAIGERTGKEGEVLLRLSEHYQHQLKLWRVFLAGVTMPAIQFVAALFIVGLFIWLVGILSPTIATSGSAFDVLGIGLGYQGLRNYILIVATGFGVAALLAKVLLDEKFGAGPYRLAVRIPVVGQCLELLALSRMAWALAMANDAGMSARRSVQLALKATQNTYYDQHAGAIDAALASGREMHEALRATGAFPAEFLEVLSTGEQTGQIPEALLRLAREYQQRAESLSAVLTTIASFAVWAAVALFIIYMIIRLAMIYFGALYGALDGL